MTTFGVQRARSLRLSSAAWAAGFAAGFGMAVLYSGVLIGTSGLAHLAEQWARYGPVLVVLWSLFGLQVALLIDVRRASSRGLRATDAAAGGTTAIGMLACCAHHVADLVPIVASVGIASVLVAWQPWILAAALVLSVAGTTATARRWARTRRNAARAPLAAAEGPKVEPCRL